MKTVRLGNSDLAIGRIGFGCMGLSEFYGATPDDAKGVALLHQAMDLGVNFFDTADMYGPFHNEQLLGKAVQGRRDKVVVATKFGILRDEKGGFLGLSGSANYIKKACDASLKRLNLDAIDLYYMHRKDPRVPIEETVGAMADLVKAGKVRYLGLSEVSGDTLKKAHVIHPISAVQSEYSIWSTDIEDGVIPACNELGVTLVAYSPLGRGFLTGKIKSLDDLEANDYRRVSPRFQGDNLKKNLEIVAEVEAIAASKGVKPSQIAMAWVLAKGENIVPIPGTKRAKYLIENVASDAIELSSSEMATLDQLAKIVAGTRYDSRGMSLVNA